MFDPKDALLEDVALDRIYISDVKERDVQEDSEDFKNLCYSVAEGGVQIPILLRYRFDEAGNQVQPAEGIQDLELVDGCQRLGASNAANLDSIPAYIRKMTDNEAQELQFICNEDRVKPTQAQKLQHIKSYIARNPGLSQAEVAKRFHMQQPQLSALLGTSKLIEPAYAAFQDGSMPPSFAIKLSRMPEAVQRKCLKAATATGDNKMTLNDFTGFCDQEKKAWVAEQKGETVPTGPVPKPRTKKELLEKLEHLNHLRETTPEDSKNFSTISTQYQTIQWVLQVDPQTVAEREKARKMKTADSTKEKADEKIAKLEEQLAEQKRLREESEQLLKEKQQVAVSN